VIGLAIWVLAAASLTAVFRDGLRLWRASQNNAPLHQEARSILEGIARDFRNAMDVPGVGWRITPEGVTFATIDQGAIQKITYQLSPSDDRPRFLYRIRQPLSPVALQAPVETPLTEHQTTLSWEYATRPANGAITWLSDWKPVRGRALPFGIRVQLTLFDGKTESQTYTRTVFCPGALRGPL